MQLLRDISLVIPRAVTDWLIDWLIVGLERLNCTCFSLHDSLHYLHINNLNIFIITLARKESYLTDLHANTTGLLQSYTIAATRTCKTDGSNTLAINNPEIPSVCIWICPSNKQSMLSCSCAIVVINRPNQYHISFGILLTGV